MTRYYLPIFLIAIFFGCSEEAETIDKEAKLIDIGMYSGTCISGGYSIMSPGTENEGPPRDITIQAQKKGVVIFLVMDLRTSEDTFEMVASDSGRLTMVDRDTGTFTITKFQDWSKDPWGGAKLTDDSLHFSYSDRFTNCCTATYRVKARRVN